MVEIKPITEYMFYDELVAQLVARLRRDGFTENDIYAFADKIRTDPEFSDNLLKTLKNN